MVARVHWASRRSRHTASPYSSDFDSLIVTHPFHPLTGQRLPILFERMYRHGDRGRVYICDGGAFGTVTLPEPFTDRGAPPAPRPLTAEVLTDLAAVVSAVRRGLDRP
jgi:uncharacterized protein DUF5372